MVSVAEAVGSSLVRQGVDHVFGVVGSGNFHVTNAMRAAGAVFVPARHEAGAATMADAYARMSGSLAAVSVHQGPGLTNAMTGITEAAKSRTPLVVVAAEATQPTSNFYVDQEALARAIGAVPVRVESAASAVAATVRACAEAHRRHTVLLNLPLDVQGLDLQGLDVQGLDVQGLDVQGLEAEGGEVSRSTAPVFGSPAPREPEPAGVERLAAALARSQRAVFVAGRGARGTCCRDALERLGSACGALLATSAVAKGMFNGNDWNLDVSGGFASPVAAELIRGADLIVGWGCALNMWTMRHGKLIGAGATVVQVDDDEAALGLHRDIAFGVLGDVRLVAEAVAHELDAHDRGAQSDAYTGDAGDGSSSAQLDRRVGYRTPEVRALLVAGLRWRDVAYDDESTADRIDPRTLSIALDDLLPAERVVAVDSGNFMGYPSMFWSVPDEQGFCFTQAYQSIGLGLATAIGAALAQPSRLPVAALGDGGALMSIEELETVVRLGLPMVVVDDDEAYGAEVHHFAGSGADLSTVRFPPVDIAALARGFGFDAVLVRRPSDLEAVGTWLAGPRDRPLLVDAKVTSAHGSWWLEEAFGH